MKNAIFSNPTEKREEEILLPHRKEQIKPDDPIVRGKSRATNLKSKPKKLKMLYITHLDLDNEMYTLKDFQRNSLKSLMMKMNHP